jgi:ADP-ribose pyrophosphatase
LSATARGLEEGRELRFPFAIPPCKSQGIAMARPAPTTTPASYDDMEDAACLRRYEALQSEQPDLFVNPPGCPTQILLDKDEILRAKESARANRAAHGMPTHDLRVGLLADDVYIGHVVRDAVRFSDGTCGLYNRVVASGGITVLPILGDAIALIRIFRHAPRRWFLEAPQGFLPQGADPAEITRCELMEEIGASVTELTALGTFYTSTAMTSECLHMFAARIAGTGAPQTAEGIEAIRVIPLSEIDSLLCDGTICDGPTTALITHARLRDLL